MVSVVTKHCTTPIKILVLQFPLKYEFRMPAIQDEYEVEISKTVQLFDRKEQKITNKEA